MSKTLKIVPLVLFLLIVPTALSASEPSASEPSAIEIASLECTTPDGAVTADADGELRVDRELRSFFDYFLSARGEVADAVLVDHVADALAEQLPASAAADGVLLFERYLRYADAARAALPAPIELQRPEATLRNLIELRRDALGATAAEAFFGTEERLERAALELYILHRDGASPERQSIARKRLDTARSAAERKARNKSLAPVRTAAKVDALRASGASERKVQAVRAEAFGDAAAERLAELDRSRAEWNLRIERFRADREALRAERALDDAERAVAIEMLLAERFSEQERLRVEALDRIAATR